MSNPMDYFEIGRKARGGNAVTSAVTGALGDFKTRQNEKRKYQQELDLATKKSQMMSPLEQAKLDEMKAPVPEGMVQESVRRGNVTFKNPLYAQSMIEKRQEGMFNRAVMNKKMLGAGAQSTPINAALQSAKSARKSIGILFPDGTPKSYRADIATMKTPFLGRPALSKDAQDLAREYGIALDLYNRQVTGAAFSQPEFQHRMDQFRINLLSNPEAAYNSLKRLEELSNDYLKIADPSGIFSQQGKDSGVEQQYDNRVQELISEGLDEEQAQQQADEEFGL